MLKAVTDERKAGSQTNIKRRQPKRDENQTAFAIVQQIIKETEGTGKNPLAVALGRMGGLKGGKARAEKMPQEQRTESARLAAVTRWQRQTK
jgi:hypothetical protein